MPSPFPGMDPYLERHWGDVHHNLITYARDALHPRLPRDLRARVEERVEVALPLSEPRFIVPDLRVLERKSKPGRKSTPANHSSVAVAEPLIVVTHERVNEGFIEIRDVASGNRIVTVIEVLSLSNKLPGIDREKYLQKREELLNGAVSLVEIDFLRTGARPLPIHPLRLPPDHRTPYLIWVQRGWRASKVEVYRIPLRERLPVIRIPLRETDEDIPLNLQPLIDQCYENGDYEADLDYQRDPDPPLDRADARWADALLRKTGYRKRRKQRR
jgi:hypothetical protein